MVVFKDKRRTKEAAANSPATVTCPLILLVFIMYL